MPEENEAAGAANNDAQEKDPIVKRLHGWAALAVAVTGLATAVFKPQDHTTDKAAYAELTKAIEQLNAQDKADHDDIVALRAYVALKEGQPLFSAPVVPATSAEPVPAHASKAAAAKPLVSVRAASPAAAAVMLSHPPAPASSVNLFEDDLPPVHPDPAPVHPAAFDAVVKSAK